MNATVDLDMLFEGFRLYCLAEGKQPTTIRWYMGKLRVFRRYLQVSGYPTDATLITSTHLRAFLVHLREEVKADQNNPAKPTQDTALSPKTIQGYARTLKAFFSWAAREELLSANPAKQVRIPKAPHVLIATLSDEQVQRLFAMVDQRSAIGFRDYCILLMLLDTGIRLSELVQLQVTNLDLERGFFKVLGKGARERLVPFGAKVQKVVWKYLHQFRPEPMHPNIHTLFLRSDGQEITRDQVYRLVRRYGELAGITGVRCSPHTLRHTFAKSFLLNGGDLFTLQKILGHSSLAVVRMYVELTPEEVQIQHRQYSPMDRLKT